MFQGTAVIRSCKNHQTLKVKIVAGEFAVGMGKWNYFAG